MRAPASTMTRTVYRHLRSWQRALFGVALMSLAACGSTGGGCAGCAAPAPIPGGFPAAHRFDNAGQIRLSSSGVTYLEQNFEKLVLTLMPGGLSFAIPPSGCGSSQEVCCGSGSNCKASIDIQSVDITPQTPARMNLNLRAKVSTTSLPLRKDLWLYWLTCNVQYDTSRSSPTTAGLVGDIDLVVDANNGNKLKIVRQSLTVQDFDCGDLNISGGVDCTIASWLCPLFKSSLLSGIQGPMETVIDDLVKTLPTGTEARFDLSTLMASFSPTTSGQLDYLVWGGGYAQSENSGVSVGALGGFHAAQHNSCVPDCEKAGASCSPPAKAAISRSAVFRGNTRPDGKAFHVGIGVHRQALDQAAYGMYSSGGLCIDVSTQLADQLNSGLFSLLVPSLNALTAGRTVPIMLAVRPQKPPTIGLGAGTWHTDKDGKPVIDDALIKATAKDFAADVYALIEQRWVRLFTVFGDLDVPVLLYADAQGRLQPMIGDLTKALTNVQIKNSAMVSEDPAALAKLFPTILGVASSFLSSGFAPIELPAFAGIKLGLDSGSITSVDNNDVLAIFAQLELVQGTSASGDLLGSGSNPLGGRSNAALAQESRVRTEAHVVKLDVPETAAFRVSKRFDPAAGPMVTLALGAALPTNLSGPVEYSYRIDGGFWRPWTQASEVRLRDPVFWLQGRHSIDVQARLVGQPKTTDPSPVRLPIIIDTVPPKVSLQRTATGVRVEVEDLVTPKEKVQLSWRIDGQKVAVAAGQRELSVPSDAIVEVEAKDEVGNRTNYRTLVADVALPPTPDELAAEQSGCRVAPTGLPSSVLWLALFGLALWLRSRRRR